MPPVDSTVIYRAIPTRLRFTQAEKRALENFATALREKLAPERSFVCLISDDRELSRLNEAFLAHDYPTDVLSFPEPTGRGTLGEVAISIERADAQAHEFGHSRMDEVRVLMLHGLLHLSGMDHERDLGEMAWAEHKWREHFGLPTSLIERASAER